MIDRYLLRYFLAVVDCGSFSKAANQVNVAQPTLSVGIRKLEEKLGAKLFVRSNKRIELTGAGARLVQPARRIELEFNTAEAEVHEVTRTEVLKLGILSTISMNKISGTLKTTIRELPSNRLHIMVGTAGEIVKRLSRGNLDVALTVLNEDATYFKAEPFFKEGYAMAISSQHPLADKEVLTAEELADTPAIIRRNCEMKSETSAHFVKRGVRPFVGFRSSNDDHAISLISAGLGGALMPDMYTMEGVVRPRLAGFDRKRRIGLIYGEHAEHLQRTDSKVLMAIRNGLKKLKS